MNFVCFFLLILVLTDSTERAHFQISQHHTVGQTVCFFLSMDRIVPRKSNFPNQTGEKITEQDRQSHQIVGINEKDLHNALSP